VLFWGCQTIPASGAPRYLAPGRIDGSPSLANSDAQNPYRMPLPRGGILRNLFVRHNRNGGAGTATYVVHVDGVATAITVALSTNAIGQGSDLVNSVAVVQGQTVGIAETISGGPGGSVDCEVSLELA
jgi:hypothetical protein